MDATKPAQYAARPRPTSPRSRQRLYIGLAIMFGVALLFIGAQFVINRAQTTYGAATTSYKRDLATEWKAMEEQPADTDAYIAYLNKHDTALGVAIDKSPKQHSILWSSNAAAPDAEVATQLTAAANNLRTAVQQYRAFLQYRDGLLLAAKDSGGTITTVESMRTTLTQLQAVLTRIQALTPPKDLENHKQQKIMSYVTVIAGLNGALAAYDKGDSAAYITSVQALAESVKKINNLSQTSEEMLGMHQHYETLKQAYDTLEKLVQ
jgi:hypothetical protein